MNFFEADTHWWHTNIIKYCNRPFANMEEMMNSMRAAHNQVVGPNDTIYHIGDVMFGNANNPSHVQRLLDYLDSLNFKQMIIIPGSHDHELSKMRGALAAHFNKNKSVVLLADKLYHLRLETHFQHYQEIVLCHWAMRVWHKSHYGTLHLYGHSHGNLFDDPNSLSMDVGVDTYKLHPNHLPFAPFSMEEIQHHMSTKTFKPIDHHGRE